MIFADKVNPGISKEYPTGLNSSSPFQNGGRADWQSAIQQAGSLRYAGGLLPS